MVHRRELSGEPIALGNQGALWGNAMTWWDHGTGSIWSQPLGEAILGPLKGSKLELMSSSLTTWEAWREAHPNTVALDVPAWDTAFALEQMAIIVDLGTEVAAYEVTALWNAGVVNDTLAGVEIGVVIDPEDPQRWAVFSRRLENAIVELEVEGNELIDVTTGTVFDPFVGSALTGPLEGQTLARLPALTAFPKDVGTFFPDARRWP